MDGLTVECMICLNDNQETKIQLLMSQEYKNQEEAVGRTLDLMREVARTRNIHHLLKVEQLILTHSLEQDTNSPEERQSVKAALEQLDDCQKCLDSLVSNPDIYRENVEPTYSAKMREAGLPLDAARQFFKSHLTRLSNNLVSKASDIEKIMLRQRRDNVGVMRDSYIDMQEKALKMAASGLFQGYEENER